jgi:hypothetical protein
MKRFLIIFVLFLFSLAVINAEGAGIKRQVSISYTLSRIPKIASNQLAVWIEDESGKIIRTLFVTKFTAKGGYKNRAQALQLWTKKFGVENKNKKEMDAVASATQTAGVRTLLWDCTDDKGNPVKDGKYFYLIEGNIFWDNMVYARGSINIGAKPDKSTAVISYKPENAGKEGILVSNVSAIFQ